MAIHLTTRALLEDFFHSRAAVKAKTRNVRGVSRCNVCLWRWNTKNGVIEAHFGIRPGAGRCPGGGTKNHTP